MQKRLAVAFTGPSGNGKTTLILKLSRKLIYDFHKEVAIIKHDPKDKARFDVEGKDSYKFSSTGAEVIVTSPTRTTLFSQKHQVLEEMIDLFHSFDILLVEGLKNLPLPRIGVFRNTLETSYFPYMDAIAIDHTIDLQGYDLPQDIEVLDLNNPEEIISWILNNAKEV